jgi:hypothetical protein
MIKITVELLPHGDESRKRKLGEMRIWNTLTGTPTKGDYKFSIWLKRNKAWRTGEYHGFPRKRKNVWFLIKKCLEQVL